MKDQGRGYRAAALVIWLIALAGPALAEDKDRLGVPGPILFDGEPYALAWSANPSANYFKQQYLPPGQALPAYQTMLLLEIITGDMKVMDAARAQMEMLHKRKGSDPLVNMNLMQHPQSGEALLDFLLSGRDADGKLIVEWNAYRYAPYQDADGQAGILLFGVSRRAYGDDAAKAFLGELKTVRTKQITALTQTGMPAPQR